MAIKIKPRLVGLAVILLSLLAAGGVAVKEGIAPGGTGLTPDSEGGGGG